MIAGPDLEAFQCPECLKSNFSVGFKAGDEINAANFALWCEGCGICYSIEEIIQELEEIQIQIEDEDEKEEKEEGEKENNVKPENQ